MKTFTVKEFNELKNGKRQWKLSLVRITSLVMGGQISKKERGDYVLSIWGKEDVLKKEGRSVWGNCAQKELIKNFKEGQKYLLHLGDPYELEATAIGKVTLAGSCGDENDFLLMQTDRGSILQCYITSDRGVIPGVKIIKEIS